MDNIAVETSYTINEIANLRSISEQSVLHDIYHGRLPVHAWLPYTVVNEVKQQIIADQVIFTKSERTYEGYVQLYPIDVRQIMQSKRVPIRSFPGKQKDEEIVLRHGVANYWIGSHDLVVLEDSLIQHRQKQKTNDIKVTAIARLADIIPDLQRKAIQPARRPNFDNIIFKGQEFAFGLVQADILKQLYKAACAGDPKVHFKRLFVEAGSQSMRMRDVFKSQPDWKDLICHDTRGYYWLHPDFIVALNTNSSPF
jgi:hypothetical protein